MSYPQPILSLDFVNGGWHPALQFSRASTGTVWDKSGILRTARAGVPRRDHDPLTGVCKGLLVSEQRTNLLTYSQEFDNPAWMKGQATITANAAVAPDGTTTMDKVVEGASSNVHYALQTVSAMANVSQSFSVFVKAGERSHGAIRVTDGTTGVDFIEATFNLIAGTVVAANGGTGSGATAGITHVGGGIYRVSVAGVPSSSANTSRADIYISNGTGLNYTGDGTSGLYIWGAQLEAGSFPTSYIPTTSAAVTRSADVCTLALSNLLDTNGVPQWNGVEGTLVVTADTSYALKGMVTAALTDTSTNNMISMFQRDSGGFGAQVISSNSIQADLTPAGTITANTLFKHALAFKENDFAACANGGTIVTDSVGTVPVVTRLELGSRVGSTWLSGHFRQGLLFNRRLSNAQIQALTAA